MAADAGEAKLLGGGQRRPQVGPRHGEGGEVRSDQINNSLSVLSFYSVFLLLSLYNCDMYIIHHTINTT